ncbi:MAG: ABC transporter permease, partial [Clostridia bacterium]|nr:ABC transporter permease [Clostridia bacterium]
MERIKALWQKNQNYVLTLIGCILIALIIGGILMAVSGYNPLNGYYAMIKGALGSPRCLGNTLDKSMTLCLLGLATAIGAKGGLFNVGGEGQLFMGALISTMMGLWLCNLPSVIVIVIAILSAIVAGGFYAYIPAVLKIKMGVDEVITTIMLNTVAIKICTWLVNGPWNSPLKSITTGTDYLPANFRFAKIIASSNMSVSFLYGAIVAFLIWYLLKKTTTGLQIKIVGENPRFAKFAGLKADNLGILSMVISGAICGLVGMFLVYGFEGHMTASCSNSYYFDGMLVAM